MEIINRKAAPFDLVANTGDDALYIDELLNHLTSRFGTSSNEDNQGYALDNEPILRSSSHPRIHPDKFGVQELIDRSISLSTPIEDSDNDPLSYAKLGGLAWLNMAADGTLSGLTTAGDEGLNSFQVHVGDLFEGTDTATLNITVDSISDIPTAPTGLTAEVTITCKGKNKSKTVKLNWSDNSGNESGRKNNKTCTFFELATIGENITHYEWCTRNRCFQIPNQGAQ